MRADRVISGGLVVALLLDSEGRVAYFDDEGFSVTALMGLKSALAALEGGRQS